MFKIRYKMLLSITLACFMGFAAAAYNEVSAADNPALKNKQAVQNEAAKCEVINQNVVKPLDVVDDPARYLNRIITMNATFDKFSILGLDYKPALRENANYIGFLIQRDDVLDHDVPLSEMKLFLKREYAEKFIDLDTGDKIQIKGKVFSTALNDPWIDVNEIIILKKAKADTNKDVQKQAQ